MININAIKSLDIRSRVVISNDETNLKDEEKNSHITGNQAKFTIEAILEAAQTKDHIKIYEDDNVIVINNKYKNSQNYDVSVETTYKINYYKNKLLKGDCKMKKYNIGDSIKTKHGFEGKVISVVGNTITARNDFGYEKTLTVKNNVTDSVTILSDLSDYTPWSGAIGTYEIITDNNKLDELDNLLEEWYPDGLTMTELNDLLWFDGDMILAELGLNESDEEDYEYITSITNKELSDKIVDYFGNDLSQANLMVKVGNALAEKLGIDFVDVNFYNGSFAACDDNNEITEEELLKAVNDYVNGLNNGSIGDSQSQEIGNTYDRLSRKNNEDVDKLMSEYLKTDRSMILEAKYPHMDPIFSEEWFTDFMDWYETKVGRKFICDADIEANVNQLNEALGEIRKLIMPMNEFKHSIGFVNGILTIELIDKHDKFDNETLTEIIDNKMEEIADVLDLENCDIIPVNNEPVVNIDGSKVTIKGKLVSDKVNIQDK